MTLAIGVDVGGTKVAAGVVDEYGRIIAKLKRSTPAASPPLTEHAIADVVTELLDGRQIAAIGLGAAGFVDSARATMLFASFSTTTSRPRRSSTRCFSGSSRQARFGAKSMVARALSTKPAAPSPIAATR